MITNRFALGNRNSPQKSSPFYTENSSPNQHDHVTHRHDLFIEGHKLVALSFNPYTAGPPIILLHGICSSIHYWTPELVEPFIQQGPCYALSLPGHYPAVLPNDFQEDELNPVTIARLLGKAIRQLFGKQKVILVGHSTGGFAALSLGAFIPDMVKFIVSISGFAQGQWMGVLGHSQALAQKGKTGALLLKLGLKLNFNMRPLHKASLRFFSANHQGLFTNPNLEQSIDTYLPYTKQLDLDALKYYFMMMPEIDISPFLSRITAPTLALTGDSDPIVPPQQSALIAAKVAQAELQVLPGAGHLPFYENPLEYRILIANWFDQNYDKKNSPTHH